MWCASLISGLFSMNIPGPGCTLTNVSLSFHHRIRVGDPILVTVRVTAKDDVSKSITFDCQAINGAGTQIFSGTAQVLAPDQKNRWSTLPVAQLIVNNPYRHYLGLIARANTKPAVNTAVAWPCDEVSLGGAYQAFKRSADRADTRRPREDDLAPWRNVCKLTWERSGSWMLPKAALPPCEPLNWPGKAKRRC